MGIGKYSMLLLVLICSMMDQNIYAQEITIRNDESYPNCPLPDSCDDYGFDSFLKRFCTDSVFQRNRLASSLVAIEIGDLYNEEYEVSMMGKTEWKYMNFHSLPDNYLVRIRKITETKYKLNVQIEDTGVSVNYIFELIDCQWFLTTIIDEST